MGFKVKLDTNGSDPDALRVLLDEGIVDFVAMYIKNSPEEYAGTCGLMNAPVEDVGESIRLLLSGRVPFEFRTTVVDELHDEKRMRKLAQWISGAPRYFLQAYTDTDDVIEKGYHTCSEQKMNDILRAVAEFVPAVEIRGASIGK